MDQIDHANELAERERDNAIACAAHAAPAAEATGHCLNCLRRLRKGLRWCNAECRDDWQVRRARQT